MQLLQRRSHSIAPIGRTRTVDVGPDVARREVFELMEMYSSTPYLRNTTRCSTAAEDVNDNVEFTQGRYLAADQTIDVFRDEADRSRPTHRCRIVWKHCNAS